MKLALVTALEGGFPALFHKQLLFFDNNYNEGDEQQGFEIAFPQGKATEKITLRKIDTRNGSHVNGQRAKAVAVHANKEFESIPCRPKAFEKDLTTPARILRANDAILMKLRSVVETAPNPPAVVKASAIRGLDDIRKQSEFSLRWKFAFDVKIDA
ncbi:hypothetical protein HDU96_010237 [Phlyctochytrium bullatum]|nr:hypothetical protein HDU96_010237 [Phlyctochytrium bullatum]